MHTHTQEIRKRRANETQSKQKEGLGWKSIQQETIDENQWSQSQFFEKNQ